MSKLAVTTVRRWWVHGTGFSLALMLPAVVLICVWFIAPLGTVLAFSFDRFIPGGRQETAFVLDNYVKFFFNNYNLWILRRTILLGAGVSLLTLVLAYPLALTIARGGSRLKGILIAATLMPLMTSVVVRSYGWTILLANIGPIRKALTVLGLGEIRPQYTMAGVVLSLTQVLMPFMVLTLVGVLQAIESELLDAARSLGASRWKAFRDVLLPLSLPGVAAGTFLVFALSIGAFATPRLVGGASVEVMATMIYDQVLNSLNWPFASASSLVLLVLVLAMTLLHGHLLRVRGRI
jgi:putative spermidine/putrescine transport system permease protein